MNSKDKDINTTNPQASPVVIWVTHDISPAYMRLKSFLNFMILQYFCWHFSRTPVPSGLLDVIFREIQICYRKDAVTIFGYNKNNFNGPRALGFFVVKVCESCRKIKISKKWSPQVFCLIFVYNLAKFHK